MRPWGSVSAFLRGICGGGDGVEGGEDGSCRLQVVSCGLCDGVEGSYQLQVVSCGLGWLKGGRGWGKWDLSRFFDCGCAFAQNDSVWGGDDRGGGGDTFDGVGDVAGAAWGCDVGVGVGDVDPGFFVDVADDLGGVADDAQSAGVGGGEVESVEEGIGAALVDASGGEGVDHAGDGDLDGVAVFERGELEVAAAGLVAGLEEELVAVGVVGAVEAVVEVAEDGTGEGCSAALEAAGLDVAAEFDFHGGAPLGAPRGGGGVVVKS